MSCFSPPRLAGTPGSHKVSWKQSKYNQAHLEVERNVSQDHRCDFWEVTMLEARTEEYILDRDIHWQGTESRPRGHTSSLPSYYWGIVGARDNLKPDFQKKCFYFGACMTRGQSLIRTNKESTRIYFSREELLSLLCSVCSLAGSREFFHQTQEPKGK